MFLKISQISQENTCARVSLLKKRLWRNRFPVNFAKFLRTPFLQNTSERLLLYYLKRLCFDQQEFAIQKQIIFKMAAVNRRRKHYILYILLCLLYIWSIFLYIYYRYIRMSPERFYQLLELVVPHIGEIDQTM